MDGPFRGSEARNAGLVTRDQLRGPRYRRLFPDVYVPAGLALGLDVRSQAAFLLVRDGGGVLAGYSAAQLLGADCAPWNAPAEVLVPRFRKRHPRLCLRYGPAWAGDVVDAGGCRVTTPLRTAWDLARRLRLVEAVVAVDALARAGGFAPAELLALRAGSPGARGCRRLDEIVALSDPRAESPPETRLRVGLVRAGLPPPEVQYLVSDEHGFALARLDLAYPVVKLAIEYDGSYHLDPARTKRDRERDAILSRYSWQTLRLGSDNLDAMPQTVHTIAHLLELRGRRPA